MVDLERHSVVDVLDDRSVESAKAWLRERPTIEVVSRDRCGLYAQAAREGAPQARQVADRFHLVQNLREAIKEQMSVYGHAHVRPTHSLRRCDRQRQVTTAPCPLGAQAIPSGDIRHA